MNFRRLFQEFNPSKFVVYSSVLALSILLGIRLDNYMQWSYWVVFVPLWIWKLIMLSGATTGTIIWIYHPEYRRETNTDLHAMLISAFFQLFLFIFEVLLCGNLDGYTSFSYRIVFIPLYCLSSFSIAACIWGFKHDRSLELETFFSVSILQLICISLKLDNVISWKWVIVFVPLWIVLTLICVIVLYYVIWVTLFLRSPEITARQRKGHIIFGTLSCFMIFPALLFFIALTRRLDEMHNMMYTVVFIPLQLCLFSLVLTAFYQKGGNHWWFGIRKDFCEFLLDSCPCLREYGNISCKFADTVAVPISNDVNSAEATEEEGNLKPTMRHDQSNLSNIQGGIEMPD